MVFKIGIVGTEELKWLLEEQKYRAKERIEGLLRRYATKAALHENIDVPPQFAIERGVKLLTVVSGRCPISICDNCGRKSFSNNQDPTVGYVTCEFCGQKKKRRAGGVDIWSEEIAYKLGIKKEIYPAEVNQWHDEIHQDEWRNYHDYDTIRKIGYRSRNIQIAEACGVLYCFAPHQVALTVKASYCKHCGEYGHPSNGGCWTMKYAKKLGKETHLVVIE